MKFKKIITLALLATCVHSGAMDKKAKKKKAIKTAQSIIQKTCNKHCSNKLIKAVEKGNVQQVDLLIKNGANVNANDNYGITPLYEAAYNGHTAIVKLLLKYKADPNIADQYNYTVLAIAARNGHINIVKLLLNAGATIKNETLIQYHLTPLQIAIAQGDTQAVTNVLPHNKKITKKLLEIPAICGNTKMMYFLLQFNPSQDVLNHAYNTIKDETDDKSMMVKKMLEYWYITQQLIAKTSDATEKSKLRNKCKHMILHTAAEHNQHKFIKDSFLLDGNRDFMMSHIARIAQERQ